MKFTQTRPVSLVSAALALAGGVAGDASASAATPISKVLEMMQEMAAKGEAEKKAEEVAFSSYSTWCENEKRIKTNEIGKADNRISDLKASIQKSTVSIEKLTERIQELEDDIVRWKKDQESTSAVRSKETTDYQATAGDYESSQNAIASALATVQARAGNVAQADFVQVQQDSLLQVSKLQHVPQVARRALLSFIQEQSEDGTEQPGQANAYESQSGGVIDLLDGLRQEFRTKKTDLDTEEAKAQHAFEQIQQALTDNIENAEYEIKKKTALRGQTQQSKADTEGDLEQTTADRGEDQKYLDETSAMCDQKATDFANSQKLRADELTAISSAIETISSDAVKGAGEKHLPQLFQLRQERGAGAALVQTQARSSEQEAATNVRVAAFLAERAKLYNSRLLSDLAQRVNADPFTKIKKMIKDLVYKIMEEATAETEHKGWCDTELGTNKLTRESKTEDIAKLSATKEELTAEIQQLTEDLEALTSALAELADSVATAQDERAKSKAKNDETVADAKAAQAAVESAIAVLKDFYEKAGAAALLQEGAAATVTSRTPTADSVFSFLDVIMSDFARLESDTAESEGAELNEFKNFMFESDKDKAMKENEKTHKSDKKSEREGDLQANNQDLATTQQELSAAVDYYNKLKPSCVDSGTSYDDRVKRREAEMQSLKEALEILQQQR